MENGNEVGEEMRLPKPGRLPYLAYALDSERQVVCSPEEEQPGKKVSLKRIPELRGATTLWPSCYGWIPVVTSSSYSLFNPATCDTIKLPTLQGPTRPRINIKCFVLSSPPSDPNCLAFILFHSSVDDQDDADDTQVAFCRPAADRSWTVEFYREKLLRCLGVEASLYSVIGFSGKLCAIALDMFPRLVLIERDEEEDGQLKFTSLGGSLLISNCQIHNASYVHYYLVESSCGEVLLVCVGYYGSTKQIAAIKVFRLDVSEMKMVEVRSLRDKLFICARGCIACPSSSPGGGGGGIGGGGGAADDDGDIYFMEGDVLRLYSFSLEQQSLTVHMPWGSNAHLPSGSQPPETASWVFLHHHHHHHGVVGIIGNEGNNNSPAVSTALQHTPQENQKETSSTSTEEACSGKSSSASSSHQPQGCSYHHDHVGSQQVVAAPNLLLDLQADCLASITKRLYPKEYINFRAACKKLQLALPEPKLPWKTASKGNIIGVPCPWFMHSKNDDRQCNVIDPSRSYTFEFQVPQELSGARILCSQKGWLVMCSPTEDLFFYKPFTGEIGRYPPRQDSFSIMGVGLSTVPPTSSDCLTLVITGFGDPTLTLDFIRLAHDKEWHRVELEDVDFYPYMNPVCLNGAFFCLGCNDDLAVFTPNNTTTNVLDESDSSSMIEWNVVLQRRPEASRDGVVDKEQSFLATCDGELLYVFVGRDGKSVQVLRLDNASERWKEVESLGNHMLFVGNTFCFSALAEAGGGMENKIYFPRYYGPRRSMNFYSLETKRFHLLDDHEVSMEDLLDTGRRTDCCWIEGGGLRLD